MFSPKRKKLVTFYEHYILQNFLRVSFYEQLLYALRSFVPVAFCGLSPYSVHLLHPFQKILATSAIRMEPGYLLQFAGYG